MEDAILFIYNADAGFFSKVIGSIHKAVKPETYSCSLCKITHSHFGMHSEWTAFFDSLELSIEFYYKDQIEGIHPEIQSTALPAVYLRQNEKQLCLANAQDLLTMDSKGLQELILKALDKG